MQVIPLPYLSLHSGKHSNFLKFRIKKNPKSTNIINIITLYILDS